MRKWWLAPVIGAGLLAATVGVSAFAVTTNQSAKKAEVFQQLDLFADILAKAQANYVTEFESTEAIEAAINGMLASLDPHSSYLDPDDFKDMQTQTSGEYGGLGIEVTAQDGFVKVVSPMDGTPASRAGIKSGDFLTAIDQDFPASWAVGAWNSGRAFEQAINQIVATDGPTGITRARVMEVMATITDFNANGWSGTVDFSKKALGQFPSEKDVVDAVSKALPP